MGKFEINRRLSNNFGICTSFLIFLLLISAGQNVFSQSFEQRLKVHYIGKHVVVRLPLPHTRGLLVIHPDKEPAIDKPLYALQIKKGGLGIEAGVFAVIKEIKLSRTDITFELIGVGYELPPGAIAPEFLDEDIWGHGSARIRIKRVKSLSGDQVALSEINRWLSEVVETRALVSAEDLPEEMQEAIRKGIIHAGMNQKAVYLALGWPSDVIRELKDGVILEAWLYEREDFSTLMVSFRDGLVTVIKEY